jgi:hypothetical protein
MALIACPECGAKISDKSNACIKCGFPLDSTIQPSSSAFPRLDGLYVLDPPEQQKGFLGRTTGYMRWFMRFWGDGATISIPVSHETMNPVPLPTVKRTDSNFVSQWTVTGNRIRIVASNGHVSYFSATGGGLTLDPPVAGHPHVYRFMERVLSDD